MLKSMNVHNTAEAYDYQLKFVRSQLKNKIAEESDFLRDILDRSMQICAIQEKLVIDGKIDRCVL